MPYNRLELGRHKVRRNDHVALETSEKRSHQAFRVTWWNPRAVLNQARDVLAIRAVNDMNFFSGRIEHRLNRQAPRQARLPKHAPAKTLLLWVISTGFKAGSNRDDLAPRVQHLT